MTKNVRKLNAEVEKNLKAIDEVCTFRQTVEILSTFYLGYLSVRQFGEQIAECPNATNQGEA